MCINLKKNAYENYKQFQSISSRGMCRKSLHVRTVILHFVEIGEVLNIKTWHKGRLLLLENIVSKLNAINCRKSDQSIQVCQRSH